MKKIISLAIIFATIVLVSCKDDFEPLLTASLETKELSFGFEGGSKTFELESNESWSISDLPDWIFVKVKDNSPTTRSTTYVDGKKEVTIVVNKNDKKATRTAEIIFTSKSGKSFKVSVEQDENPDGENPISSLTISLDEEVLSFDYEGGSKEFDLESNENWSINDLPDWVFVKVKDNTSGTKSTTYVSGKKEITVTVLKNDEYAARETELIFSTLSDKKITLSIQQAQKPQLLGYWILSEGYAGQNNAELAWYDIAKGELLKKQFSALNDTKLGDTGNDLKIYGSKMYCVVTGPGMGAAATEGTNYIEVINPANGKSIKRIPFTDAKGAAAKPRNIVFEDGKGYISSYSNEVVRLDTATLTLDAFATLSGTLAEVLAINDGKIYVCNSGHGADNKISVVDTDKMQEVKVITTAKNPTSIVSTAKGELFFNTNYPDYKLYKLTTEPENIEEIKNISASSLTFINNSVYTCSFSWTTYKGSSDRYNLTTNKVTPLNLDLKSHGIGLLMEYKIGAINDVEDIFISGMGDDVVIYDTITKEIKYTFKTGVPNGSGVVAYFKK